MLSKDDLGLNKKIKCLPNPCIFSINEVVVATSTADVLRDMKKEEIVKMVKIGGTSTVGAAKDGKREMVDQMDRFCRQVLGQRR